MKRIDAHTHTLTASASIAESLAREDLQFLNICIPWENWRTRQAAVYVRLAREYPDRFAWCTTFDLPDFHAPDYAERAIVGLAADFASGAVGCKIWKHVGMELKAPDGSFVMPDDPVFDPIYEYLASSGKPLLMHIAEPRECWLPIDPKGIHFEYYLDNPDWHCYGKPEIPSYETLIEARDNILERHPGLKAIGAHLGSMEHDVREVAKRLDKYPNFAVDTAARLKDLIAQPRDTVRDFLIEYADRILLGTDTARGLGWPEGQMPANYAAYFEFFGGAELDLPSDVLDRIYRRNAQTWYGLCGATALVG